MYLYILRLIIVISIIFGIYCFREQKYIVKSNREGFTSDDGLRLKETLLDKRSKTTINKSKQIDEYIDRLNDLDNINKLDELEALMNYGVASSLNNNKRKSDALKKIDETERIERAIKRAWGDLGKKTNYKPPEPLHKFSKFISFFKK